MSQGVTTAAQELIVGAHSAPLAGVHVRTFEDRVNEGPLEYDVFFRAEFGRVLRTIELMMRDHGRAEEITQDAFVQLLLNWRKISRYERPDAWVRRVAIRLASRSARRERLFALFRGEFTAPSDPTGGRYDLTAAIRQLPTSQRAAIVLHSYEDRPVAEIAGILGCAEPTARVHLHRARKRLAALLGEADDVV